MQQRFERVRHAAVLADFHGTDDAQRIFQVIRVIDHGIIAVIAAAGPDVLHQLGLTAVAGAVEAFCKLAVVGADDAGSLFNGARSVGG